MSTNASRERHHWGSVRGGQRTGIQCMPEYRIVLMRQADMCARKHDRYVGTSDPVMPHQISRKPIGDQALRRFLAGDACYHIAMLKIH